MAQFVLKIEKLSHIIGARESRDLRSPSPIMAPEHTYVCQTNFSLVSMLNSRSGHVTNEMNHL